MQLTMPINVATAHMAPSTSFLRRVLSSGPAVMLRSCASLRRFSESAQQQQLPLARHFIISSRRYTNYRHASMLQAAGASPQPAMAGEPTSALQQLKIKLPSSCCGCGIRLQQTDPDAPGYFIVSAKLLEPQEDEEATPSTSPDYAEPMDEYERARREADAEMEAYMADRRASSGKAESDDDDSPAILCQRCYALKHYGKVKVAEAEGQLPEFDLAKKVGRKIFLQKDRRAVVLCVVDVWDFDGSLPRLALRSLYPPGTGEELPEEAKFKLMVAVNKFDLLPKEVTPTRVMQWVRARMKQAGLPRPEKVFMVSALKGMGVKDMVEDIKLGLGFRGDLWVVGAQNAGKSSLINAMKRIGGTSGQREPTVAPMPGTTLGLLKVPGLPLGPKNRAFDTPGVPHLYQLTSRLNLEEVKAVLPSKQLRGRTFRVGAGNTLLIGGLARLDIMDAPGSTIYLTLFASHNITVHLGKTEGAEERLEKHVGGLLAPPSSLERFQELPKWEPRELSVEGTGWDRSTVDIAIAGLGWIAIGCNGRADFQVWTQPGIAITSHAALVPDYAQQFERPGFSSQLPKSAGPVGKAGKPGSKK